MALVAASPSPVALTHDRDYLATVASIKQKTPIYNEGSRPTGIFPLVLDGTFQEGEIILSSGETRRVKTTQLTAINSYTIDKIDLIKAIRENRLATYYCQDGVIKILSVHHEWRAKIELENALTVATRIKIDGHYSAPNESDDIIIAKLPDESYQNMIRALGFETLIASKKEESCIIL